MKFRQVAVVAFAVMTLILGASGETSAAPSPANASDYLAVAYSPVIRHSFPHTAPNLKDAERLALVDCHDAGGNGCRGTVWVHYGYAAVAEHKSPSTAYSWGWGWGHTSIKAEAEAIKGCKDHDSTGRADLCKVWPGNTFNTPNPGSIGQRTTEGGEW